MDLRGLRIVCARLSRVWMSTQARQLANLSIRRLLPVKNRFFAPKAELLVFFEE
jgi:hypothetical protein